MVKLPMYMDVNSEKDLRTLNVLVDSRIRRMAYYRIEPGGELHFTPDNRIFLIQIPDGYAREPDARFDLWTTHIRDLKFDRGMLCLDSYHRKLTPVEVGSALHSELKSIVDLI